MGVGSRGRLRDLAALSAGAILAAPARGGGRVRPAPCWRAKKMFAVQGWDTLWQAEPTGPDPVAVPGREDGLGGAVWAKWRNARTVRIELYDEPGGKSRLELRAGPYAHAGEGRPPAPGGTAPFSHPDTVLKRTA